MISKLIISSSKPDQIKAAEEVLNELNVKNPHPDLLCLEAPPGKSLGVKEAKQIREHLSFKPHSAPGRVVVIVGADSLSLDAQNSLLKTLEEPVETASIILTAQNEENLLATIRSRTVIIRLKPQPLTADSSYQETVEQFLSSSLEHRFEIIEKVADKDKLLNELIIYVTSVLPDQPKLVSFAKLLIEAEKWNKAQGNTRAILEYLALSL